MSTNAGIRGGRPGSRIPPTVVGSTGGLRTTAFVSALLLMLWAVVDAGAASEGKIEVAIAKATHHLDAGEAVRALEVLDAAERELGPAGEISYYRGLAFLEQNRMTEAETSFRDALGRDPDLFETNLMLGILLNRLERRAEASALLEKAIALRPDDARAYFWAGRTAGSSGDTERAQRYLAKAEELDPALPRLQGPGAEGTGAGGAVESPFRLKAWVGLGYDDNVTLEADDGNASSDEDDFVGSAVVLATYRIGGRGPTGIDLYYGAYVTGHEDLSDYDIQHHRAGVQTSISLGPADLLVDLGGEYTLVGGHTYRTAAEVGPSLMMSRDSWVGSLNLSVRVEHYFNSDVTVRNPDRTGHRYRVGYRHAWSVGRGVVLTGDVGYILRQARAEEREHEGFDLAFEFDVPVAERWGIDGLAVYEPRNYDAGPGWPGGRHDDLVDAGIGVRYRVGELWTVRLDYRYHRTDSDVDAYSYTQNIVRMSVGVEL